MELDRFAPTLGQNGTTCAILPLMICFIVSLNVVQAVLWLIRLTKFQLAQIITPLNNNDSTKSKHS